MPVLKKIYYVPGLISAILIPLLFWYYAGLRIDKTVINVIDVWLPSKIGNENSGEMGRFIPPKNWTYKKLIVPPNRAKKNSNLYVSEIKKLKERNEKETGIEFVLNKKNSYGDFVSLLNDLSVAKVDTYGFDLNDTGHLFVSYTSPITKSPIEECYLCNDHIISVDPNDQKVWNFNLDFIREINIEFFFNNMAKLPKNAYYIIFGFLLFLNISMLSIKGNFQINRKVLI